MDTEQVIGCTLLTVVILFGLSVVSVFFALACLIVAAASGL